MLGITTYRGVGVWHTGVVPNLLRIIGGLATKADLRKLAKETKGDIDDLAQITAKSFAVVDQRFAAVDQRFDRIEGELVSLKSGQAAMIDLLKSLDQQLKEHKTHPDRIARLERSVFR